MLKRLRGFGRAASHIEELEAAYVPAQYVTVDAPAPFAALALQAAAAGDFDQVDAVFSQTLENRAWLDRSHLFTVFVRQLETTPQWLDAWAGQAPDNPHLAVLRADLKVIQAWQARSGNRASKVRERQFQRFFELLDEATALIRAAWEALPTDPEPVRVALTHARGSQADRALFDRYVEQLWQIEPLHQSGNEQALQYECAKWFGSREQMYAFAREVTDGSPSDAAVQGLLLTAVFEDLVDGNEPEPAVLQEALDRARGFVAAHPQAPVHITAQTRNMIAAVCRFTDRPHEAYAELLTIGPHATEFPWAYYGDDARKAFLDQRSAIAYLKAREL